MLRFVAYARVSTDEQSSTAAQFEQIVAYALRLDGTIIAQIEDVLTGHDDTREGYQRILAMARRREMDGLVVWKVDRLGRDHIEGMVAARDLEKLGVRVYSVTEPIDDPFVRDMLLLLANRESRVLAERVKLKQRANVQEGLWQWPPPPGYRIVHKTPDDQRNRRPTLEPDEMAMRVRQLFVLAATGNYSLRQLRDEAHAMGLKSTRGNALSRTHLHGILTNPVYMGDIAYGRRPHGRLSGNPRLRPEHEWLVVKDVHPSIVDRETFGLVQTALKQHKRFPATVRGTAYLLTGLLRCAHCGSRMYGSGGSKPAYTCTRGQGYGDCSLRSIGGKGIDEHVRSALRGLSLDAEQRTLAEEIVRQEENQRKAEADAQRRNLASRRQTIEAERLARARNLLRSLIAPDVYARMEQEDADALRIIDRTLSTLEEPVSLDIRPQLAALEIVDWDALDEAAMRDFALLFIEQVKVRKLGPRVFEKGRRGSRSQLDIEVVWTAAGRVAREAVLQSA